MNRIAHWDGSPDGCSENCQGPHLDDLVDAPEVCPRCGSNGRACAMLPGGCRDARTGGYEPWEGLTGAEELADYYADPFGTSDATGRL